MLHRSQPIHTALRCLILGFVVTTTLIISGCASQQALVEAARNGNDQDAENLVDEGFNPYLRDESGESPISLALDDNPFTPPPPWVEQLLAQSGKTIQTILRADSSLTKVELAAHLASETFYINAPVPLESNEGKTTLLTLMVNDNADPAIIELLLENGANPRGLGQRDALRPPLAHAIYREDLALAKVLLDAGTDPDVMFRNKKGQITRPLIEVALWSNNNPQKIELTKMLLEEGASPKLPHGSKLDAATVAAAQGDVRLLKLYEQYGFDLTKELRGGSYPLHHAASAGHAEVVKFLLNTGVSPNQRNSSDETPLQYLVYYAEKNLSFDQTRDVIKILAAAGADMNAKNEENDTPLAVATIRKHHDLATTLLEEGADPAQSKLALLVTSASLQDAKMTHLLLKHGANPNRSMSNGGSAPIWAAVGGEEEPDDIAIENMLVEAGADLNIKSTDGESTALFVAATMGKPKTLAYLISAGAEVNGIASNGLQLTALQGATLVNELEAVKILLNNNADPNSAPDGWPPLMYAAENPGLAEIAKVLIKYGAKVDARGSSNTTALHRAAKKGHLPVIRVLLENGANPLLTHEYGRDAAAEAKHMEQKDAYTLIKDHIAANNLNLNPKKIARTNPYPAAPAPKAGYITCNTQCINGDCYRTYSDGEQVHFQAERTYNSFSSQWEYDSGSC